MQHQLHAPCLVEEPLEHQALLGGDGAKDHARRREIFDDQTRAGLGQIASGSPADFLLVDYRPATEFSSRTLLEHLWCGLLRAPVSCVMVAGEIIMDNGIIVAIDEREVAARARECAKRVWKRLG